MGAMASQFMSFTIVYSTVHSDADQRKHQSSASLAFVRGVHRSPLKSPHKWLVTRKMFPFDDIMMLRRWCPWKTLEGITNNLLAKVWQLQKITSKIMHSQNIYLYLPKGMNGNKHILNLPKIRISIHPKHISHTAQYCCHFCVPLAELGQNPWEYSGA